MAFQFTSLIYYCCYPYYFYFYHGGKNTTWPLDTKFKKKKNQGFFIIKKLNICKRKEPICINGYNIGRRYVALRILKKKKKEIDLNEKKKLVKGKENNHLRVQEGEYICGGGPWIHFIYLFIKNQRKKGKKTIMGLKKEINHLAPMGR